MNRILFLILNATAILITLCGLTGTVFGTAVYLDFPIIDELQATLAPFLFGGMGCMIVGSILRINIGKVLRNS
jgi:hypothetical protein